MKKHKDVFLDVFCVRSELVGGWAECAGSATNNETYKKSPDTSVRLPEIRKLFHANCIERLEPGGNVSFVENDYPMIKTAYKFKSREPKVRLSRTKQREDFANGQSQTAHEELEKECDSIQQIPRLNTKVLETWINETLKEVEVATLPKHFLNDESKAPLSKFGIDREKLTNFGMSNITIDRIYRALFVYTIGFHELMRKSLTTAARNFGVVSSIWKVYALLLEHSCDSDYKLLIGDLVREHKQEVDRIETDFTEKLEKKKEMEAQLAFNIEEMQKYLKELEQEREAYRLNKKRMEAEISQSNKSHDEEVQLRLKFETKLNGIYSVYRDLQNRYERALSDIKDLIEYKNSIDVQNAKQKDTIAELKTKISQNELKIIDSETRCRSLEEEVNRLAISSKNLEERLTRESEALMRLRLDAKELEKTNTLYKLSYEAEKEKSTLIKKENDILKQIGEEEKRKREDVQSRYEKLYEEHITKGKKCQEMEEKYVAADQSAKNIEAKLKHCKKDLAVLKKTNGENDQEIGLLRSKVEYLSLEKDRLEKETKLTSEKLTVTLKAKNTSDSSNEELKAELDKCKQLLSAKEETVLSQRLELERSKNRLTELERENGVNETKKRAFEKETEISKRNLSEKIRVLEDRIKTEVETKESLILRCNEEEKAHSETKTILLKTASEFEDVKLRLRNLENALENKERISRELLEERTKLQNQLAKLEVEKDSLQLDKEKGEELVKKLEEFYKMKLGAKKEKKRKLKKEYKINSEQNQCIYEDLYSRCSDLYQTLTAYINKVALGNS